MELTVNEDEQTIALPAMSLTALGAEELMRALAQARSKMQPPVVQNETDEIERATWSYHPDATVSVSSDPDITLGLRHEGYGWLFFQLDPAVASGMAAQLHAAAGEATVGVLGVAPDPDAPRH